MPQCRNCDRDLDPSFEYCPHCGAPIGEASTDLEQQVRALLQQGQKIAAVKLYKEQTGVGLAEAKTAVEALAAKHGLETPRGGCLGVVLALLLVLCQGCLAK